MLSAVRPNEKELPSQDVLFRDPVNGMEALGLRPLTEQRRAQGWKHKAGKTNKQKRHMSGASQVDVPGQTALTFFCALTRRPPDYVGAGHRKEETSSLSSAWGNHLQVLQWNLGKIYSELFRRHL